MSTCRYCIQVYRYRCVHGTPYIHVVYVMCVCTTLVHTRTTNTKPQNYGCTQLHLQLQKLQFCLSWLLFVLSCYMYIHFQPRSLVLLYGTQWCTTVTVKGFLEFFHSSGTGDYSVSNFSQSRGDTAVLPSPIQRTGIDGTGCTDWFVDGGDALKSKCGWHWGVFVRDKDEKWKYVVSQRWIMIWDNCGMPMMEINIGVFWVLNATRNVTRTTTLFTFFQFCEKFEVARYHTGHGFFKWECNNFFGWFVWV